MVASATRENSGQSRSTLADTCRQLFGADSGQRKVIVPFDVDANSKYVNCGRHEVTTFDYIVPFFCGREERS